MEKVKLFCLPHAGASSYYYLPFKKYFQNVDVVLIELKGRGKRFNEPFYTSFEDAVNDIYSQIKSECIGDYGIFGHSMGSWLAYELYYKLLENNHVLPKCMFFSGREAPNDNIDKIDFTNFSNEDFEKYLKGMGGIEELSNMNENLTKVFYEIIRADFNIISNYDYQEYSEKIKSPAVIMSGTEDEGINFRKLTKWSSLIEDKVSYTSFNGSHFYMTNSWDKLSKTIEDNLVKIDE
ncbi:thioesterase [Sedimentibacter sp. zth1]|uniref:thioesterase II family protein n=1 Tax=Sedimentibacter sp. zth1 TaxID=2816908 RepID=UPI001A91871E|nr:thioesterase [Sedimentibacter sp. zth1]QSX05656.1 thioesterase [Sedimentibacter sp. zth1]